MGNPSLHDHENLPILVAGGAATGLKGGRHIKYDKGTPLANLHLTLLDRVGVRLDSFGDSDGKIDDLFEPVTLSVAIRRRDAWRPRKVGGGEYALAKCDWTGSPDDGCCGHGAGSRACNAGRRRGTARSRG